VTTPTMPAWYGQKLVMKSAALSVLTSSLSSLVPCFPPLEVQAASSWWERLGSRPIEWQGDRDTAALHIEANLDRVV